MQNLWFSYKFSILKFIATLLVVVLYMLYCYSVILVAKEEIELAISSQIIYLIAWAVDTFACSCMHFLPN